jgi:hypothetical protein
MIVTKTGVGGGAPLPVPDPITEPNIGISEWYYGGNFPIQGYQTRSNSTATTSYVHWMVQYPTVDGPNVLAQMHDVSGAGSTTYYSTDQDLSSQAGSPNGYYTTMHQTIWHTFRSVVSSGPGTLYESRGFSKRTDGNVFDRTSAQSGYRTSSWSGNDRIPIPEYCPCAVKSYTWKQYSQGHLVSENTDAVTNSGVYASGCAYLVITVY